MSEDNGRELTEEEQAYEAKEVGLLLKHRAVQAAFEAVADRIKRQWEMSADPLSREMCWHKLKAFQDLKTELRAIAERTTPVLTGH